MTKAIAIARMQSMAGIYAPLNAMSSKRRSHGLWLGGRQFSFVRQRAAFILCRYPLPDHRYSLHARLLNRPLSAVVCDALTLSQNEISAYS